MNQALTNNGVIDPGSSGIGSLTLDGDLVGGVSGTLKFELASLSSFDRLAVSDDVTLGGDLGVWNLGYSPSVGDSFIVMTFDERLNGTTFASLTTHDFGSGVVFKAIYNNDHDVTLSVTAVPEPQTYLLMLLGLGLVGGLANKRLRS